MSDASQRSAVEQSAATEEIRKVLTVFSNITNLQALDLRSPPAFARQHLVRSVNIPSTQLKERMFELPKRDSPFYILCPRSFFDPLLVLLAHCATSEWLVPALFLFDDDDEKQEEKPFQPEGGTTAEEKGGRGKTVRLIKNLQTGKVVKKLPTASDSGQNERMEKESNMGTSNEGGGGGGEPGKYNAATIDCSISFFWQSATNLQLTREGLQNSDDVQCLFEPLRFLAEMMPFMESCLEKEWSTQRDLATKDTKAETTTAAAATAPVFSCVDVGCGSGRDTIWLARRKRGGSNGRTQVADSSRCYWKIFAVEMRESFLTKLSIYAKQQQLSIFPVLARIRYDGCVTYPTPKLMTLEKKPDEGQEEEAEEEEADDEKKEGEERRREEGNNASDSSASCPSLYPHPEAVFKGQWGLVLCVHFLERGFLPALLRMVKVGGFLVFSTFIQQPGFVFTTPKDARRILKVGELRDLCHSAAAALPGSDSPLPHFQVLVDRVEVLEDGSMRPVNQFCARRIS